MIYLAQPYTSHDPAIMQERYFIACKVIADLINKGYKVFSPIVYGHYLVQYGTGSEFADWEEFDKWMIDNCSRFVVLRLEGWEESVGVKEEIEYADSLGKYVEYMDVNNMEEWEYDVLFNHKVELGKKVQS